MDMDTAMLKLQPWIEATEPIEHWVAGARALALLRATLASGMLDAAQTARTPRELAEITGIEANRLPDLCAALVAHGYFNAMIGRQLRQRGFTRTGTHWVRYWNAVTYEWETE